MPTKPRVPRSFVLAAVLVLFAAGVCTLLAYRAFPIRWSVQLVLLLSAVVLSENFAFSIERWSVTLAFPLAIAATVLCGPLAGCLTAAASAVTYQEMRDKPLSVVGFNLGQLVLSTGAAGLVYVALGGRVLQTALGHFAPWTAADFPQVLIPLAAMSVLCVAGNLWMSALGMALYRGVLLRETTAAMAAFVPTQLALAFVGCLVAQVLAITFWALPLFIAPLVVARQLFLRYEGLKIAYVDTIRSLVRALEAKDPYTRGHSERVSAYAAKLGAAVGLERRALERLEYAALLHDLGKLAVPGAVLTKPGRLEPDEMDRIREHPARGAEMVKRIPHLRDLADTVAQHHERVDGRGYPAGLIGSELQLAARILAVADSFDAMTTTRAYRRALDLDEALAELRAGAGSQFDAEVVGVFVDNEIGSNLADVRVAPVRSPGPTERALAEEVE